MTNLKRILYACELERKIDDISNEFLKKDCQRVEFLRGMMAAYKMLIQEKETWEKNTTQDYFK